MSREFPYIWSWGTCGGKYPEVGKRKGMGCRIVARLARNSALLVFEDGFRTITSRNGVRKDSGETP
jgi:hypothetical protein